MVSVWNTIWQFGLLYIVLLVDFSLVYSRLLTSREHDNDGFSRPALSASVEDTRIVKRVFVYGFAVIEARRTHWKAIVVAFKEVVCFVIAIMRTIRLRAYSK